MVKDSMLDSAKFWQGTFPGFMFILTKGPAVTTPFQPSQQTQQLLTAAGQAAADDAAAEGLVGTDQQQIEQLNQQLATAGTTLSADQQAAASADAANKQAFLFFCQSLASDYGVPLPLTIPAPAPPSPPAGPANSPVMPQAQRRK